MKTLLLIQLLIISAIGAEPKMIPFETIKAKWSSVPLAEVKSAAEKGDPTAQHFLGRGYFEGTFGQPDIKAGVQWYEKAVAQDFPNSQANLGSWLYFGERGVGEDRKRGLDLLRRAAETGDDRALLQFGKALRDEGNAAEAAENLEASARKNNAAAMYFLGEMYFYGELQRDKQKAVNWYKKSADHGEPAAMARLAEMLEAEDGNKFQTHPGEAKEWREKAIEKGYRFTVQQNTADNLQADMEKAEEMLQEARKLEKGGASEQERAYAIYLALGRTAQFPVSYELASKLAWMYENGKGVRQDDRKALEYYSRAFMGPGTLAETEENMLRLIDAGRGLSASPEENMALFSTFLARGYMRPPGLSYRIAAHLDAGKIIPPDVTAAVRFYKEAAMRGSVEARNRIGELWAEGVDGKPDLEEAAKWYRSAALRGSAAAQVNLGKAYASGAGVEKDSIAAFKWLTIASKRNEAAANQALADLKVLPQEQTEIDRLKAEASSWETTQPKWLRELGASIPPR